MTTGRYSSYKLPDKDLAWLTEGTPEFDAYLGDMTWSQRYAFANRARMLDNVLEAFATVTGRGKALERVEEINNHHNFTRLEEHRGERVWLTRKGAIPAAEGELGIIPGSVGTRSYIVEGLGNADSYCSCSHGAGRRHSRGQARRTLTTATLQTYMEGRAWNASDATALLDEHPEAYKDIDVVMEDQKDLVRVRHTLRAVLNFKGVNEVPRCPDWIGVSGMLTERGPISSRKEPLLARLVTENLLCVKNRAYGH